MADNNKIHINSENNIINVDSRIENQSIYGGKPVDESNRADEVKKKSKAEQVQMNQMLDLNLRQHQTN